MFAAPVQLVILKRGSPPVSSVGKNTPNGKPRRVVCPTPAFGLGMIFLQKKFLTLFVSY
jgi:hypothetical protein